MNIAEIAFSQGIKNVTLGFSTGKDSIVGFDLLKKANITVLPIYFYICPDLDFIKKNIELYENYFNQKIIQLPHPILYDYLRHQDWQSYQKAIDISQVDYAKMTFKCLIDKYLKNKELSHIYLYDANCMKMADSLNRRLVLGKKSDICNENKIIYLTKYFTDKDIYSYIKENNIPLTDDYKIFGRSWDGLSYHFLTGIKQFYPKDYQKIIEMFELIEAETFRYKLYKKHSK